MKIVCVDQSRLGLLKLKRIVKEIVPDAEVDDCRKPSEVLLKAGNGKVDVLLTETDFGRSRWEGLQFARKMKKLNPHMNIIFVTAESGNEIGEEFISLRASGMITKPYGAWDVRKEFENLRYPVG